MSCEKCQAAQKSLDLRNEATKVWIQSDTQCRKYAHELEQKIVELKVDRDELAALLAGINAHVVPGSLDSIDSLRMMYRERGDLKVKLLSAVKALERIARGAPIVGYDPSEIAQEALDLIMEKKSPTV